MSNKSGLSATSTTSLEQFVYADVAPEPNGMSLSVLSALARRGLDPWQEARRLAELPAPAAVERLAKTLVGLPLMRSSLDDATAIAGRCGRPVAAGSRNGVPGVLPRGASLDCRGAEMDDARHGGALVMGLMPPFSAQKAFPRSPPPLGSRMARRSTLARIPHPLMAQRHPLRVTLPKPAVRLHRRLQLFRLLNQTTTHASQPQPTMLP